MTDKEARRVFWWTRSRLLEHGVSWEEVRALTPAQAARRWVEVRRAA